MSRRRIRRAAPEDVLLVEHYSRELQAYISARMEGAPEGLVLVKSEILSDLPPPVEIPPGQAHGLTHNALKRLGFIKAKRPTPHIGAKRSWQRCYVWPTRQALDAIDGMTVLCPLGQRSKGTVSRASARRSTEGPTVTGPTRDSPRRAEMVAVSDTRCGAMAAGGAIRGSHCGACAGMSVHSPVS